MKHTDQIAAAITKISNGMGREFVASYINGALPAGWRVCHGPEAVTNFDGGGVIVVVSVEGPRGEQAGVRFPIFADALVYGVKLEALGAELGSRLRQKCEEATIRVPPGVLRFKLAEGAKAPTRGSDGASGYDLHALAHAYVYPGRVLVVDTGVSIELPGPTWEAQVRPRSGMTKRGLCVQLGTVDSDYRGTIGASIINHTAEALRIDAGDRIAQLVLARVEHPEWSLVDELTATARGDRGWGSTGK